MGNASRRLSGRCAFLRKQFCKIPKDGGNETRGQKGGPSAQWNGLLCLLLPIWQQGWNGPPCAMCMVMLNEAKRLPEGEVRMSRAREVQSKKERCVRKRVQNAPPENRQRNVQNGICAN